MTELQKEMELQNSQLSTKLQTKGAAPTQVSFKGLAKDWFEKNQGALSALMGSPEDAKRLYLAALNVCSKNKMLLDCSPGSIFQSLMQCAELKLYPGPLQEAAIVPFWNSDKKCFEAQFMPQYQGLVKLAMNSGHLISIETNVVRENDDFEYEFGTNKRLRFTPAKTDRGEMIAAYALAHLRSGGVMFEVMHRDDVYKIRERSKSWANDQKKGYKSSVWSQADVEPWMWRKTVLKQLLKLIPKSVELADALEKDTEVEADVSSKPLLDLTSGFEVAGGKENEE